jgi:hypothetical protein
MIGPSALFYTENHKDYMQQYFSYILAIVVVLGCAGHPLQAQKPTIKYVKHQQFLPSKEDTLKLEQQKETYFNEYADRTREELFVANLDGKLVSKRKKLYSYDSKGRHQNTLEYNGDNLLEKEIKIYWDSKNNKNKIEQISYVDGKQTAVSTTYLLEYDANGNKEEERYFDDNGEVIQRRVWNYNKQNEVIKSTTWIDEHNKPSKEVIITYKRDKDGNLSKSVSKEKVNGKLFRKDIRFFEKNYVVRWKKYIEGKFVSEFVNEYRDSVIIRQTRNDKRADPENTTQRVRKGRDKEEIWVTNTEYDVYGNVLISTQSMNDQVIMITQYAYDDYGNKIKTVKLNKESNEKEEERLSYDDWGNVAKRTLLKNDEIVSVDKYEYEYHEKK